MSEENKRLRHLCDAGKSSRETGIFLENRGDGWYLHSGDNRGRQACNYCPYCGLKLKSFEELQKGA